MRVPATASFLNASLVLLPALAASGASPSRAETLTTSLLIDATATRESISPFVYGQFIEHLGRCI